jgi:hypothetical protein
VCMTSGCSIIGFIKAYAAPSHFVYTSSGDRPYLAQKSPDGLLGVGRVDRHVIPELLRPVLEAVRCRS